MDYRPPGSSVHGDSPGKSTGVGCHALLLQGIFPTQGSNPGLPHGRQIVLPTEPPGKPKNTGVGSLSLLQGIFPNQESNQGLPHWRWILYQLSHKRSPRILELVAYPFSRGSSQPRNWTGVSCIAGGFFTNWAIRKAPRGMINLRSKAILIVWTDGLHLIRTQVMEIHFLVLYLNAKTNAISL